MTADELATLAGGRVDILLGCPPCQGFSDTGKRDPEDPRNDHITAYGRFIEGLRPLAVVMENVPLLANSPKFQRFKRRLERCGYLYTTQIVNAAQHGSCQTRQRLVLIAIHKTVREQLVLDVNGEMIDAARSLGGLVITLPDPKKFGLSLALITSSELIQIAPNVQDGTVYAELIELSHERLKAEKKGAHFTFEDLQKKMNEMAKLQDVKAPSLGIAINRVRALEQDPIIGGSFDFIKELVQHKLVVLDCRFLSLRQTRLIAAAAARELQRKGREMAQKAATGDIDAISWFTLLMVDEAHQVAPHDENVVSSQVMFELARMGRHVRTGLVLISQSPSDLNTNEAPPQTDEHVDFLSFAVGGF